MRASASAFSHAEVELRSILKAPFAAAEVRLDQGSCGTLRALFNTIQLLFPLPCQPLRHGLHG